MVVGEGFLLFVEDHFGIDPEDFGFGFDAGADGVGRDGFEVVHNALVQVGGGPCFGSAPGERVDADRVSVFGGCALRNLPLGVAAPADEAAGLVGTFACRDGAEGILFDLVTDHIGAYQAFLQRLSVEKLLQQPYRVKATLTVGGDEDGSLLVFVFQVVLEGFLHILVGQVEGTLCFRRVEDVERLHVSLAVAGGKDAAAAVEDGGLEEDGEFIRVVVDGGIAQVGVPGIALLLAEVGGGMDEEDIGADIPFFVFQEGGDLVAGILLVGRGGPAVQVAVIGCRTSVWSRGADCFLFRSLGRNGFVLGTRERDHEKGEQEEGEYFLHNSRLNLDG